MTENGWCCNDQEKTYYQDIACSACSNAISMHFTYSDDVICDSFTLGESINDSYVYTQDIVRMFKISSSKYREFKLIHEVSPGKGTFDFWNDFDTEVSGVFPLNNVYGDLYKSKIYASISIKSIDNKIIHSSVHIKLNRILWKNLKTHDGNACIFNSSIGYSYCVYILNVVLEDNHIINGHISDVKDGNNRYVQYTIGSKINIFRKEFLNLKVIFSMFGNYSRSVIDQVVTNQVFPVNGAAQRLLLKGLQNKVTVDISLTFFCNEYTSTAIRKRINSSDEMNFSSYCQASYSDYLGSSKLSGHCKNGGIAKIVDNKIYCQCKTGYFGSQCQYINMFLLKCYKGSIKLNKCYCDKGYFGKECQWEYCDTHEKQICSKDKICLKSINGSKFCTCFLNHDNYILFSICPENYVCVTSIIFWPKNSCSCKPKIFKNYSKWILINTTITILTASIFACVFIKFSIEIFFKPVRMGKKWNDINEDIPMHNLSHQTATPESTNLSPLNDSIYEN